VAPAASGTLSDIYGNAGPGGSAPTAAGATSSASGGGGIGSVIGKYYREAQGAVWVPIGDLTKKVLQELGL